MKAMKAVVAIKPTKTMKEVKKRQGDETVWRCCQKTWPAIGHHGEWLVDLQWNRAQEKVVETWLVPLLIPHRREHKAAKKVTKAMKAMAAMKQRQPLSLQRVQP